MTYFYIYLSRERQMGGERRKKRGGRKLDRNMQAGMCMLRHRERPACGSWPSPSTLWVMGIKVRQLGFPYVMFDVWAAPADSTTGHGV